jgi:hypothetical protein
VALWCRLAICRHFLLLSRSDVVRSLLWDVALKPLVTQMLHPGLRSSFS